MTDSISDLIGLLQPEGLVLGGNVLRAKGLYPERQTVDDTEAVRTAYLEGGAEEDKAPPDIWPLLERVLGWDARFVAGAPGGPTIPDGLAKSLLEHGDVLCPDMVLLGKDSVALALLRIAPELEPDARGAEEGWEASPHQRLERLLRETGVATGVLIAGGCLRLIYAPEGETSGWMTWPLAPLASNEGRDLLGGLKLAVGRARWWGSPENSLIALATASRATQNDVSAQLAVQVLGALHELMRGLYSADPARIADLARTRPQHLYEGLLATLMRLVFLLYAEDRGLLPTRKGGGGDALWQSGYAIQGLFARLEADDALHNDTMDERRGAWGQLIAVFRLIHDGRADWIAPRGGAIFDPDAFPFLEGRKEGSRRGEATVLPVSDGCVHRILEGLMTLPAAGANGARERLGYRTLDVEQIGSVYETVIGFEAKMADGPMIAAASDGGLPIFVDLDALSGLNAKAARKHLADRGIRPTPRQATALGTARTPEDVIAALAIGNAGRHRQGAIDLRGSPDQIALPAGTPYLQPTAERRSSGSHYTPRALTQPIVREALAPAIARLGENALPEDVLALKVCDPACGSGAFLVEACRQIGTRLQTAWARHGAPIVPADEDEATYARRLVAQRCLYGVDRNPMAVDLCKLSLWLATLAAEHEFTFLDHAIRTGDSLVGLTDQEIGRMSWLPPGKTDAALLAHQVRREIDAYRGARGAIRNAPDSVTREVQEATLNNGRAPLERLTWVADAVVATFWEGDKAAARKAALTRFIDAFESHRGEKPVENEARPRAERFRAARGWRPFHWGLEFPEVFEPREGEARGGFDAIVGNPPFAGKNTISAASGPLYIPWLQRTHAGAHGNADLAAHFYRRSFGMLRLGGCMGLIASNTIAQGDTRQTGLLSIVNAGGTVARAIKRLPWPGEAAVMVSVVHVVRGKVVSPVLDDRPVKRINAWLVPGEPDTDASPKALEENKGRAFEGSKLLGMGFTFDDYAAEKGEAEPLAKMRDLIARDPRNGDRIKPYLGGEEVNTSPAHTYHRYVIDFEDFPLNRDPAKTYAWRELSEKVQREQLRNGVVAADYPHPVAEDWPELVAILRERVKPQRAKDKRDVYRQRWWQYAERRVSLYPAVRQNSECFILSRVSPNLGVTRVLTDAIFADSVDVFAYPNLAPFAILQSRVHEVWARFFSSSMKDDLRYAPSDCFETFPFPDGYQTDPVLEEIGQRYLEHRAALMEVTSQGMTKTYNAFHDATHKPSNAVAELRDQHAAMDAAVLRAYGWDDIAVAAPIFLEKPADEKGRGQRPGAPEHDYTYQGRLHWPAEIRDEVLARLLALNRIRAEAETEEATARAMAEGGPMSRAQARAKGDDT